MNSCITGDSPYNESLYNEFSLSRMKALGPDLSPIVFHANDILYNESPYNEKLYITNEFLKTDRYFCM